MKKLHLICNAHIDPVWQWTWDEGISSAIATFKSAADLAEQFDYIFCHGESLLYESVEKSSPELFSRIQRLVKEGRWKITSGWYMQPDCNLPCGESIVRQIKTGQKYFKEKFGIEPPSVATGYDAFGHNLGLVQILVKCGFKGYINCRPYTHQFDYPSKFFKWIGKDNSSVIVMQNNTYSSGLGHAKEKIEKYAEAAEDIDFVLWGVGNHGGGPSRQDLSDIAELKIDGVEVFHSTPEALLADGIKIEGEVRRSLTPSMPGCYSSMARIKKAHRECENLYFATEKMLAVAHLNGHDFNMEALDRAEKQLLLAQFHDILPGTVTEDGEKEGMELLSSAKKTLRDYRTEAFLKLVMNERHADEGEYPIFVFNYMPVSVTAPVEVEFSLADQNWSQEEICVPYVYDEDGRLLRSQQIKEESTLNMDWRKRVVFEAKLKPMGITRFTVKTERVKKQRGAYEQRDVASLLKTANGALLEPLELIAYDDSADPWAMSRAELHSLGRNPRPLRKMTDDEAKSFCRADSMRATAVIEDGDVLTSFQELFTSDCANAVVEYKAYRGFPYTDVKVTVEFFGKNQLLRLRIPMKGKRAVGDGMYIVEDKTDGEICFQKWVAKTAADGEVSAVINDGVYAGCYDEDNLYLTLLRGSGYCFHPIGERPLYPSDRYLPRIDCGRYVYNLRFYKGTVEEVCREAECFNQGPYAVNVFPTGSKNGVYKGITLDSKVTMPVCKYVGNGEMIMRLFNPSEQSERAAVCVDGIECKTEISPYEVVSLKYNGKEIKVYHDEMPL